MTAIASAALSLPWPWNLVLATGVLVLVVAAMLSTLEYWAAHRRQKSPSIVVHDPEVDADRLPTGETYGMVKVPFANVKRGKGAKATGFFAEIRVADAGGSVGMDWTRAIGPIALDPNGLKHYMDTVIQVQNVPPEGGYLEPWKPSGRTGVGFKAPVVVEVRWECNEAPRAERKMKVRASDPPGFWPEAEWID